MIKISGTSYPFQAISRGCNSCLLHLHKPIWIVLYQYPTKHFEVYRPSVLVPKGRLPWTVDNKRVDSPLGKGWKTLLEAIEAAEDVDMDAVVMAVIPTQPIQSTIRHKLLDLEEI